MTFCYWLVCWSALVISAVVCSHSKVHVHYGNSSTIYVDCIHGNDTVGCGFSLNTSCKTLQFTISHSIYLVNTNHVVIGIAPDACNESVILRLDNTKTKVHDWSFVRSNQ